jgi:hypothetical protein
VDLGDILAQNTPAKHYNLSMAGYSGTPLVKKLGLKTGARMAVSGCPIDYADLLEGLPDDVITLPLDAGALDFIHIFVQWSADLLAGFPTWKAALQPAGMLWISWPKRTSGLAGNLDENKIREAGLAVGLVDVKVCAVDAIWSGLKFVYRLKDR